MSNKSDRLSARIKEAFTSWTPQDHHMDQVYELFDYNSRKHHSRRSEIRLLEKHLGLPPRD